MFQQVIVDPVRSRCTGFGLQDRTPQISQSEGLVVDFSVVRSEVDSGSLIVCLDGLEFGTVVGRGGVICKCCCMRSIATGLRMKPGGGCDNAEMRRLAIRSTVHTPMSYVLCNRGKTSHSMWPDVDEIRQGANSSRWLRVQMTLCHPDELGQ